MHALLLICINQHTTFVMPSFTIFKDMIGAKLQKRVMWRWPRPPGDMNAGVEIAEWSSDPNHVPFRGALSYIWLETIWSTCV